MSTGRQEAMLPGLREELSRATGPSVRSSRHIVQPLRARAWVGKSWVQILPLLLMSYGTYGKSLSLSQPVPSLIVR